MHHPSKLVPRLLGISRDSVMRVDEKTKEVLKTWPFTVIRSWAATSLTFTLVSLRASVIAMPISFA